MYEVVVVVAGVGDGRAEMIGAVTIGADEDEDEESLGAVECDVVVKPTIADEDRSKHGPL